MLQANHQRDLAKLREMEDMYRDELNLKNEREHREAMLLQAAEALQLETETRREAITRIQAAFRGWKVLDCSWEHFLFAEILSWGFAGEKRSQGEKRWQEGW